MAVQRVIGGAGGVFVIMLTSAWGASGDPLNAIAPGEWLPPLRAPDHMMVDQPIRHSLLLSVLGARPDFHLRRVEVDLGPALDGILGFLRVHGFPLHQDPAVGDDGGISFSATVRVNGDLPSVYFNVGDHGPLDAFYANDGGFRFALKWPLLFAPQFALHLGGGEDSEFGNWAIVGVQWRDPKRPLAIGIGMPVALKNADGNVGVVCQLRMLLN